MEGSGRGTDPLQGEGVKCAHRLWVRMVVGAHSCGCVSCVGMYGSWACIVHGRVWVVGVYGSWVCMGRGWGHCWLWALVMHG